MNLTVCDGMFSLFIFKLDFEILKCWVELFDISIALSSKIKWLFYSSPNCIWFPSYQSMFLIILFSKMTLRENHSRIKRKRWCFESFEHCEDLFSNWGMHLQFHNHAQFPFTSHKLTKIMSICVRIFLFVSYQLDCMFLY